jgi:D-threo-aldose 1-dehydrogenase
MGRQGALAALRRLQEQGIVRFVGTAADDPATNTLYMETGEFDAAVVPRAWSLLNQLATQRILPAAEKHNIGLVIANPIERGLLATGPVPGTYYFDRTYSPEVQAHVGQIKALCDGYGVPMLAVALQWIVRHPQVATSVPGARTPQEAIQNAQAAAVAIPDALWEELQPLVRDWGVGK